MPSREKVITTIITSPDNATQTEEIIVISEAETNQHGTSVSSSSSSGQCNPDDRVSNSKSKETKTMKKTSNQEAKAGGINDSAAPATSKSSSSSPSSKPSPKQQQKKDKPKKLIPANQRTIGSFFTRPTQKAKTSAASSPKTSVSSSSSGASSGSSTTTTSAVRSVIQKEGKKSVKNMNTIVDSSLEAQKSKQPSVTANVPAGLVPTQSKNQATSKVKKSSPSTKKTTTTTTKATSSDENIKSSPITGSRTQTSYRRPKKTITKVDNKEIIAIVMGTHTGDEDGSDGNDNDVLTTATKDTQMTMSTKKKKRTNAILPDLVSRQLSDFDVEYKDSTTSSNSKNNKNDAKQDPNSKKSKIKKDPNAPKRNLTAYIHFSNEMRSIVKEENPDLSFGDIAKHLGHKFNTLTKEEKGKYQNKAARDKIRYDNELKEYNKKKQQSVKEKQIGAVNDDCDEKEKNESHKENEHECQDTKSDVQEIISVDDSSDKAEINGKIKNTSGALQEANIDRIEAQEADPARIEAATKPNENESILRNDENVSLDEEKVNQEGEQDQNFHPSQAEDVDDDVTLGYEDQEEENEEGDDDDDDDMTLGNEEDDNDSRNDVIEDIGSTVFIDEDQTDMEDEKLENSENEKSFPTQPEVEEENHVPSSCAKSQTNTNNAVVNVLQTRKKSKATTIHELQPRKKVKINELQPRKKVKVNELKPRKKIKENSPSVNDKRLKAKEKLCVVNDDLQSDLATKFEEPKQVNMSNNKIDISEVRKANINQLLPRKKNVTHNNKQLQVNTLHARKKGVKIQAKLISNGTQRNENEKAVSPIVISSDSGSTTAVNPPKSSSTSNKNGVAEKSQQTNGTTKQTYKPLSKEDEAISKKYRGMRSSYQKKLNELVERALNGELEEEDFQAEARAAKIENSNETLELNKATSNAIEFRDDWLQDIAILVQGSPLPLQQLTNIATRKFVGVLKDTNEMITAETISTKIKLIAARQQYLVEPNNSSNLDIYNDNSLLNMWRWELTSLDYLPNEQKTSVKKARATRRKIKSHQKSILKLLHSIDEFVNHVQNDLSDEKKQQHIARISVDEEKVLKFERDEEKIRLQREAKIQKENQKEKVRQQKLLEKESEKREKELKRKEKELLEEEKRKEKAKPEEEKKRKKQEAVTKQKKMMLSFFKTGSSQIKSDRTKASETLTKSGSLCKTTLKDSFDSKKFREMLESGDDLIEPLFAELSTQAIRSRKRKSQKVNVRVFKTVMPDNPFDQQPYDEERIISLWNKNKFLSFHENYRPAYHGTWSKPRSSIITGKKPFAKDSAYLNYDVDSEAEWEEEDNEHGDDCSVVDNDDDEVDDDEGDVFQYNYQDGWLAQDGDLALDDDDEESMTMRKKKAMAAGVVTGVNFSQPKIVSACVIAPVMGGLPHVDDKCADCPKLVPDLLQGIDIQGAQELLSSHDGHILMSSHSFCLEPFPPVMTCEKNSSKTSNQISTKKNSSQEMSREDMQKFAKFVHNSTLKSKDLLVEELRLTHKNITSSRAQATRKLDLIANKRRLKNGGGVIWEVKNEILESLGLHDLIKKEEQSADKDIVGAKQKASNTMGKVNTATSPKKNDSPALISPLEKKKKDTSPSKKRKQVSEASANLLASFLKKKKV